MKFPIIMVLCVTFYIFLQRKNQLREAYSNNLWDGARKTLATLWDGHGAIWHGNAAQASRTKHNWCFCSFDVTCAVNLTLPQWAG